MPQSASASHNAANGAIVSRISTTLARSRSGEPAMRRSSASRRTPSRTLSKAVSVPRSRSCTSAGPSMLTVSSAKPARIAARVSARCKVLPLVVALIATPAPARSADNGRIGRHNRGSPPSQLSNTRSPRAAAQSPSNCPKRAASSAATSCRVPPALRS
ncbi:hypothetical protein H3Z74_17435 [Sphingomonas alpina]|uniref:Uncharacterized protein n=1 Tax=Sphingomonas alpina TaxID=653931 RepID=A0A7H0LRC2_9SPHN|nr:hypothetical protein [Sphingomonas alpina]QNQ12225.1 hypothetical protein H3Z74_17435 [Sphingomonas alpina]